MIGKIVTMTLLMSAASPAIAQTDTMGWGGWVFSDGSTRAVNNQIRKQYGTDGGGASAPSSSEARARATCANKEAGRRNYGADDERVRKLYQLCAQMGM